jgi:hypothetical protein
MVVVTPIIFSVGQAGGKQAGGRQADATCFEHAVAHLAP